MQGFLEKRSFIHLTVQLTSKTTHKV